MRERIFEFAVGAVEKDEYGTVFLKLKQLKNDEIGIQLVGLGFSSDCHELSWNTVVEAIDDVKGERNFLHTKAAEEYEGNQFEAFGDLLSMKQLKRIGSEDYVNSAQGKQIMAAIKQKTLKLSAFPKKIGEAMFFNGVKVTVGIYPKDFLSLPDHQKPPSSDKWEGMKVLSYIFLGVYFTEFAIAAH